MYYGVDKSGDIYNTANMRATQRLVAEDVSFMHSMDLLMTCLDKRGNAPFCDGRWWF